MYQSRPTVAINHMRTLKILQTSWAVTWTLTSTQSIIPLSATHLNLSIPHFLSGSWYEAPPNLQGKLLGLLLRSAPPAPRRGLPALWEVLSCSCASSKRQTVLTGTAGVFIGRVPVLKSLSIYWCLISKQQAACYTSASLRCMCKGS